MSRSCGDHHTGYLKTDLRGFIFSAFRLCIYFVVDWVPDVAQGCASWSVVKRSVAANLSGHHILIKNGITRIIHLNCHSFPTPATLGHFFTFHIIQFLLLC